MTTRHIAHILHNKYYVKGFSRAVCKPMLETHHRQARLDFDQKPSRKLSTPMQKSYKIMLPLVGKAQCTAYEVTDLNLVKNL